VNCDIAIDKDSHYPRLLSKPSQFNDVHILSNGILTVPKTSGGINAISLSCTKKSKLEMKAKSLAKAKAWSNACTSNKTAVKDADCA
jgi:hypothetical protein